MSNLNLNKVILAGRLTADVELKQTPSGVSVCSFTLAINRKFSANGQQQTDFIQCQAWRQTAEFIARYFKKGSAIFVSGSLQLRTGKDKDGNNRRSYDVVADDIQFVDSKKDSGAAPAAPAGTPSFSTGAPSDFEEMTGEDELPF